MSTIEVNTDEHGRVRQPRHPQAVASELRAIAAQLGEALHMIASYVDYCRQRQQDAYRDLSVNHVPEHVLQAMYNLSELDQEVDCLTVWIDQQAEEEVDQDA